MTAAYADFGTLPPKSSRLQIVHRREAGGAVPDDDEMLGAVAASEILGCNRSTLHGIPSDVLPYAEVGTGAGRGLTRRYRRGDLIALRDLRQAPGGLLRRFDDLEARVERLEQRDDPRP